MAIVFVDKDIICRQSQRSCIVAGRRVVDRHVTARGRAQTAMGLRTFLSLRCLLGCKAKCAHLRALGEYPPRGGIVGHGEGRYVGRSSAVASDDRYLPEGSRGVVSRHVVRRVLNLGAVAAGGNGHANEKGKAIQAGIPPWSEKAG